ncbi:response regulator [Shewanella abyssi]|uniref:response regulator n=1 Tax=Shewanella abyssi TaxID=311789 RepID=UPI002010C191|nr:response regulator [Shewanella abyssi]MCL1049744.1 response regulator [Shewanella abyssi]
MSNFLLALSQGTMGKAVKRLLFLFMLIVIFPATANTDVIADTSPSKITTLDAPQLTQSQVRNIVIELKYLDEVLTSSVQSYAFSADAKWLDRYRDFEPKLNALIETLISSQSIEDKEIIAELQLSNASLIKLEEHVIELVADGDNAEGISIINSDEYQYYKSRYMALLLALASKIEERATIEPGQHVQSNTLILSDEEKLWIDNNSVRIGIEHWPPMLFVNDDDSIGGLAGEIVSQIVNKTGLKVELVKDSWANLLSQFKKGEIDLLPHAYVTEERKEFGHYSTPYFLVRNLFFVRLDRTEFNSGADLSNSKVAVAKSYTTIKKIKSLYPNIQVIETNGIDEAVQMVLDGEVDALIDASTAVDDWMSRHNMHQLRPINEDVIAPSTLHLFSHIDHPLLASILQKGLDSLRLRDLILTRDDWLKPIKNKMIDDGSTDFMSSMWLIIAIVAVLLILATIITSTVLRANDKSLAKMFASDKLKGSIFIGLIILTVFLVIAANVVTRYAEKQSTSALEYNLNTLLTSTHERMLTWVESELTVLERVGGNHKFINLVEQLLQVPRDHDSLLNSPLQSQVREFFEESQGKEPTYGFFVISADNISISSGRDSNIGAINLIHQQRPDLLERVLAGNSVFVPPIRSDVYFDGLEHGNKQNKPTTMFFAAPIINKYNQVIAILTKRVRFEGTFSTILSAGFIGRSGETYALDSAGLLLSNVRFEDDLRQIGLIEDKQRSSLNLRIADPGQNLLDNPQPADPAWPLTYMARQIADKRSGANLSGYRDYRGVEVAGSWVWDDLLGVGLVAEVDIDESFALLNTFKYSIWSLLSLSLILLLGSTLFTLRIGTRATRALVRSRSELEVLVKERTQELQVSMQRTRAIIDNASDGIIVVNDHGLIQEFSPSAESIFGYEKHELLQTSIKALMDIPFHEQYCKAMENSHAENLLLELQGHCKDGNEIDIEVAVNESRLEQEVMYTAIVRDATLRKEAERELNAAKQKAEEATKAKSDFLANMSHEIRTPMNAIIGMSYLAMQTELNRKQAGYVSKIQTSAELLLGIINDILDFSKIEAGKLDLEHIDFNLNDSIDSLVHIIAQKSQQKEIELLIDIAPELPVNLVGDPLRLGQILINLANNAIKFTESGEIIIKAELLETVAKEVVVQFSVKDSGIGMTEAQLGRLFKSFSQADASTTRKYGGTGLGLTISKTLTEMMNGHIWVESDYGKGSIFYFTARFGVSTTSNGKVNYHTKNLKGLPILIVDDSLAAREILFTLTESLDFSPDLAASGKEALEKLIQAELAGNPYKLVISDWKMPNMNGLELGQAIADSKQLKAPPKFVIMTAYDRDDMLQQSKNIKLDSSLTKPVSISTLLDTVLKVMNNERVPQSQVHDGKLDFSTTEHISGAHILLVEDNVINQEVAIELLTLAGLKVSSAWNGAEAVARVASEKFDAVLMDMQMPIMDGYEATRAIRKDAKNTDLPIIAMTANAMSGDREKCIAAGMNDHLRKPIDPQQVFRTLAHWVSINEEAIALNTKNGAVNKAFNIEGFDTEAAIARMAGNLKIYKKTLTRVVNDEADSIVRVREALQQNDLQTAILVSHTLKGIAGSIGANYLVPPTEALELLLGKQLKSAQAGEHNEEVASLLIESEQLLQQMIAAISHALATDELDHVQQSKPETPIDPAQFERLIETLKEQLGNYDTAVAETFDSIIELAQLDPSEAGVSKILNALESYDFDTAETLLPLFIDTVQQKIQAVSNGKPT